MLCIVAIFNIYLFEPDLKIDRLGKQKMLSHFWTHVRWQLTTFFLPFPTHNLSFFSRLLKFPKINNLLFNFYLFLNVLIVA